MIVDTVADSQGEPQVTEPPVTSPAPAPARSPSPPPAQAQAMAYWEDEQAMAYRLVGASREFTSRIEDEGEGEHAYAVSTDAKLPITGLTREDLRMIRGAGDGAGNKKLGSPPVFDDAHVETGNRVRVVAKKIQGDPGMIIDDAGSQVLQIKFDALEKLGPEKENKATSIMLTMAKRYVSGEVARVALRKERRHGEERHPRA